jgi:hypothetical protein
MTRSCTRTRTSSATTSFATEGGGLNEDLTFCKKVREAGFDIHVDVDVPIGHISQISVWPTFEEEEWKIGLSLGNGETYKLRRFLRDEVSQA